MDDLRLDAQERRALCDLFEQLGAEAPTLLSGWTAKDLAAHLVLREHDILAGPCLVLPGCFQRFAERRRLRLTEARGFDWLVDRIRSGPPPGVFRIGWVRSFPSLNEFFVHHEDLRRANGLGPRDSLTPAMEAALWRNVRRGGRYLSRRLREVGLEIRWAGTGERITVRQAAPAVRLSGPPWLNLGCGVTSRIVCGEPWSGPQPVRSPRPTPRPAGRTGRAAVHRREVVIELTDRGRGLVDEVTVRRRQAIEEIVRAMPAGHRTAMIDALVSFAEAADEPLAVADAATLLGW